jgi:hypothetical protein
MEIRRLDSRGLYGIPSVNKYEQIIKQIIETKPSWDKDGGGVRGRTLAPIIGGASGPNLMGDPIPQQFTQQRNSLIQQQDDPVAKLNLPAIGGTAPQSLLPWDLLPTNIGTSENPTWEVKVQAGTINGILPENWNDAWTFPDSGIFYAKAIIYTDNLNITGLEIEINSSIPEYQEPQLFSIQDRVEFIFGVFSQWQKKRTVPANFGTLFSRNWMVQLRQPLATGDLPYDIYYYLA